MENNNSNVIAVLKELFTKVNELLNNIGTELKDSGNAKSSRSEKVAKLATERDTIKKGATDGVDVEALHKKEIELVKAKEDEKLATVRKGGVRELKIKKDTLQELMALEKEGSDAWNDLNNSMLDAKDDHFEEIKKKTEKFLEATADMLDGFKEISAGVAERDEQAAEEKNEKEKEALKDKFNQGLITKKEYDKGIIQSDKELDKQKLAIAKKQHARDQAIATGKILIETAIAVMSAWKTGPAAPFLIALIVAASLAQIAGVYAAPAPKARKGGRIVGGSHEQGGVLIEAEGGEAILSRAAMSAFPGVANLMNAAALSGGINDGGYAARSMASGSVEFGNRGGASSSQGIDYERLSSMMSEKMSQTKLYVAVTDINDGQRNYTRISDMAKL